MESESTSYADANAVADGFLIEIPFAPFARVTRRVWESYHEREGGWDEALLALRETWMAATARPADANGWRIVRTSGPVVVLVPNELGGLTLMSPEDL